MATPKSFQNASWRETLPVGEGFVSHGIGISFDMGNGEIVRMFLDLDSAKQVIQSLIESISDFRKLGELEEIGEI